VGKTFKEKIKRQKKRKAWLKKTAQKAYNRQTSPEKKKQQLSLPDVVPEKNATGKGKKKGSYYTCSQKNSRRS